MEKSSSNMAEERERESLYICQEINDNSWRLNVLADLAQPVTSTNRIVRGREVVSCAIHDHILLQFQRRKLL